MTLTSSPYTVLVFVDEVRVKYIIPQKKVFLTGIRYISFKNGLKYLERSFDETLLFFQYLCQSVHLLRVVTPLVLTGLVG